MTAILELVRIILILGILGALGWALIGNLYTTSEAVASFSWLAAIGILILLFVLYRNRLQFSGWYKGKRRQKLPKAATVSLIISAILLFILPFVLGSLFG